LSSGISANLFCIYSKKSESFALLFFNNYINTVNNIQQIKINYEKRTQEILKLHRAGAGGVRVALELTDRHDTLLQTLFQQLENNTEHLSVVALGGYGRKELCFSSDTDIMFLIEDEEHQNLTTPAVQEILHILLDIGLNVGHSFRTIEECISISAENFESFMSIIEARFICGKKNTFFKLVKEISEKIKEQDRAIFVSRISNAVQLRHKKYGDVSKLLEPNIKNSAGGLRDIHTVLWLLRGTGTMRISGQHRATETAILQALKTPTLKNLFVASFLKEARYAFDSLLHIRNEMHVQSKSIHDTLEFGFQPLVALHMRYHARSKRANVERFMQDYYSASRIIALLSSRIVGWANDRWPIESSEAKNARIGSSFIIRNGRIQFTKQSLHITNELVLRALLLQSERNAEFSFRFEDTIHRQLSKIRPLRTQRETDLFRLLLHRPNGVGNAFRKMNELGILERWIPEWKPMVSFFQHNQYHYYTADEHTLIVLIHAEALEHSSLSFGTVFRSLPRRDTLYISCLMHDIAKPVHIGKHEIKGVPIVKRILRRLSYDDLIEDVTFLVRHHLLMEQVAFRRNLNDPQTIADFAATFDRPELLDYLFVLTFADLSALNRNVWTAWKESLLNELYRKTHTVLQQKMTSEQIHEQTAKHVEEKRAASFRYLVPEFPPEEVEEHLEMLSGTSYLATFKPEEIANHLQIIRRHESIMPLFKQSGRYTELTLIANDARGILSKFCGVITANDVNILDAQVFTRTDGIAIDTFRVEFTSNQPLPEERFDRIARDLKEVIEGRVDIAHLIGRHRMKWKRHAQRANPDVRRDVEFEDHPQYTIIDIYAPDALGFLYRITETISRLDLNITFAKIATRVDGIVDSFYLLDSNGNKIDDPVRKEQIKKEILATIQYLSESELVTSTNNT
jgi:[protein-PII] uridylyltransferase